MRVFRSALTAVVIGSLLGQIATQAAAQLPPGPASPDSYRTVEHRYWDGAVAAPFECRGGEPVIGPDYQRPELMAIGDSLYNGVQSGRINWHLAEWSVPILVAMRMDLISEQRADRRGARSFHIAQYPAVAAAGLHSGDFGFNLDAAPRAADLLGVDREIASNLRYLTTEYRPPNGRAMVDNIAYSGANSIDLVRLTPRRFRQASADLLARGKGRDAFTYANAAFVLNPTRQPCLEDKTALQQVLLRKPRVLLVSVGANNGVWRAGFYGETLDPPRFRGSSCDGDRKIPERCINSMRDFLGVALLRDLQQMIDEIKAAPEIEAVYINGLIRPSRVANLLPNTDEALAGNPQYARTYRLDLFRARSTIRGEKVAETDRFVDDLNGRIRTMLASANAGLPSARFHFVNIDAAIAPYDRKACAGATPGSRRDGCQSSAPGLTLGSRHGLRCTVTLDNFPVRLQGDGVGRWREGFCAGITQGGLFSMDNMHPSSAGYGILAAAVREEMHRHGDIPTEVIVRGRDCPERPQAQQCTALIVQPGYLTTDNNLRETEFLAWSGTTEQRRLLTVRRLANFMQMFS